jgi:hypothetical protein
MAFVTIPSTIIESGDPVTQELFNTYIKNDLDDHETRLVSLEGGSAVAYVPFYWTVKGYLTTLTDCGFIRVPFDITLLAARLLTQVAGSGSSTEVDIEYKRGAGAWTSVFSTKPSVSSTSDYTLSVNAVLSTTAILSGDLLRMNITAVQSGDPKGLLTVLEFEKT